MNQNSQYKCYHDICEVRTDNKPALPHTGNALAQITCETAVCHVAHNAAACQLFWNTLHFNHSKNQEGIVGQQDNVVQIIMVLEIRKSYVHGSRAQKAHADERIPSDFDMRCLRNIYEQNSKPEFKDAEERAHVVRLKRLAKHDADVIAIKRDDWQCRAESFLRTQTQHIRDHIEQREEQVQGEQRTDIPKIVVEHNGVAAGEKPNL